MAFTHKVTFDSKHAVTTIKVHSSDSVAKVIRRYQDLYAMADNVTVQRYPLKNNKVEVLKG